jgi:hypothetical protein
MIEPANLIPHALASAYRRLVEALDERDRRHDAETRPATDPGLPRCVERFVDALHQIPSGGDELRRRATFVESRCGPGGAYATARARSLESYRDEPSELTGSALAIRRLRASNAQPLFLAEVNAQRQDIEHVLRDGVLELSDAARGVFEAWHTACRAMQRDAEGLEVDGCWHLLHVHQAGETDLTERAELAAAIAESRLGEANLGAIRAAADSLVAWIRERRPEAEGGASSEIVQAVEDPPNPKKPKRSTERGEGRAKLIAELSRYHRYADGSCLNCEPIGSNELADKAHVAHSTASSFFKKEFESHAKYRVLCRDAGGLVMALKVLNGDIAPRLMYGRRPPGEGNREDEE